MKKGFTLAEILVVISIIGILSGVLLVSFNSSREKSKVAQAKSDVSRIALSAQQLYLDTRLWPGCKNKLQIWDNEVVLGSQDDLTSKAGCDATATWKGPYVAGNTKDPWGNFYAIDYDYHGPPNKSGDSIRQAVVSYGKDFNGIYADNIGNIKSGKLYNCKNIYYELGFVSLSTYTGSDKNTQQQKLNDARISCPNFSGRAN